MMSPAWQTIWNWSSGPASSKFNAVNLSDILYYRKAIKDPIFYDKFEHLIHRIQNGKFDGEELEKRTNTVQKLSSENQRPTKNIVEHIVTPVEMMDPNPLANVGKKIKALRERLLLSQKDFIGQFTPPITLGELMDWENGLALPPISYCIQVSDLGGVPLDWLLRD